MSEDERPRKVPRRPGAQRLGRSQRAWRSVVEVQIRQAQEAGAFDDLPGKGKPLELEESHKPYEWWVRKLIQREKLNLLPPSLELRREVEREIEAALEQRSEAALRKRLLALDARIRHANATNTWGPSTDWAGLDVEALVARWRALQAKRPS